MAKGNRPTYSLPFSEDFTGGLTPENWIIEKLDGKMQDQYLWRFDNWYEIPVTSGNFEGDFASISSAVAGYTLVWAVLDTPPLVRGELKDGEKTFLEFDIDYNATTKKSTEAGVYYSYFFYALTHARFACHVFRQIQNCILLSFNVIYLLPSFMSALYAFMLLFTIIKMLIQIFCLTLPRTIYIY